MNISHKIHSLQNSTDLNSKYSNLRSELNSFLSSGPDTASRKRLEIYYKNHAGRELYRQRDRFMLSQTGAHGPGFRPKTTNL